MAKLEIKSIKKSFYKNNVKNTVLKDIRFDVFKGEILCVLGSSGCGKSTLLRQIAGFDTPDVGEILLDGQKIMKPSVKCIMIFQDFQQLFPWKTVLENVMFPLKVLKIGATFEERKTVAKNYLSMVQLDGFDNYYPNQLSGGMKQKAAIARALALKPEVLLMDEPFGSLDAQTRNTFQNILLKIWKSTATTIVFVTHDIQEAILLSDRILILDIEGKNIKNMISNTLPRPRSPGDPGFSEMWNKIYDSISHIE